MIKDTEVTAINDIQKQHREIFILIGIVVIFAGCCALYISMEENWTEDTHSRQRVLVIAVGLLISTGVICYYASKTESRVESELQVVLIERPPSYNSIITEDPPPAYNTVIQGILIIPQQSTG